MKRKIIFVINSLEIGGAEKSLISLLNTIDYEQYDVYLQMFESVGAFIKLLPEQVHLLSDDRFIKTGGSLLKQIVTPKFLIYRLIASISLRKNIRNRKMHNAQCYWKSIHNVFTKVPGQYDVAVAWGQGNPTHFVVEKVNSHKKIAFVNVDYVAAGYNSDYDYPFYKACDQIVAVSDKLSIQLKKVFPELSNRIVVIYDIVNASVVKQMSEAYTAINKDDGVCQIVTVGRLAAPKNYLLAVEAARILRDKGFQFHWYFVGEGPERFKIENLIKEYSLDTYITLTGAKLNPYPYMKEADIYVQTSLFEGYCLTLAEARLFNKPIVSTNFDVVNNQLRNEENGLIVEMTGEAVANGIMRLIQDAELREKFYDALSKEEKGNVEEIEKFYKLIGRGQLYVD